MRLVKLIKAGLLGSLARFLNTASFSGISLIIAHVYGPNQFGEYAAILASAQMAALFSGMSVGQILHYRFQVGPCDIDRVRLVSLGLPFGLFGMLGVLGWWGVGKVEVWVAAFLVPLMLLDDWLSHYCLATGRVGLFGGVVLLTRCFWFVVVALILRFYPLVSIGMVFFTLAISLLASICLYCVLLGARAVAPYGALQTHFSWWRQICRLHPNTVGSVIFALMPLLLIQRKMGNEVAGVYQFAIQLLSISLLFPQALNPISYARIGRIGVHSSWMEDRKTLLFFLPTLFFFMMLAGYFIGPLSTLVFRGRFEESFLLVKMMSPVYFLLGLAVFVTPQWIARGEFFLTSLVSFFTGLAVLACIYFLIGSYGLLVPVFAQVFIVGFATFFLQIWFLRKLEREIDS